MKEIFSGYLAKLARKIEDPVTYLPIERTTVSKETLKGPLESNCRAQQEKERHHASCAIERGKKYQILFITLALVLLFTSFGIISVIGLRPVALADNMLALDDTPTPGDPEAAPPDQSVSLLISMGNMTLGYGSTCEQFHSAVSGDKFCWNESDFQWGVRDSTCIYNPSYSHPPSGTVTLTFHDTTDTLPAATLNQNTCTDNSTCVSDNSSQNDNPDQDIHDQVGGDDMVCGNNACTNVSAGGNTNECGDSSGKQLEFDRFGCHMVDSQVDLVDTNPKSPSESDTKDWFHENRYWESIGVSINPTAYDPNGAIYLPTLNLRAGDIDPSQTRPVCGADNRWNCSDASGGQPSLVVHQYQGNFTKNKNGTEVTMPTGGPNQVTEYNGVGRGAAFHYNSGWSPGSQPVPIFWVVCDDVGGGWAFPCSDQNASSSMPTITANISQSLDNGQVSEEFIKSDWLSGDADPSTDGSINAPEVKDLVQPGHLEYTYLRDTVNQPGIKELSPYMMGLGLTLIAPVLVMIGYQFLWASWTFGRAGAMEAFGRMILSVSAILVSYQLAAMLISLADTINMAVVQFHVAMPYTDVTIGDQTSTFTLVPQGETNAPQSFRGIVVPISRWGCIANDFVAIIANKFWTDVGTSILPFLSGLVKLIANVFNVIDVAKHVGEFVVLILSINLCTQVFMRVVLLNYYVLTSPLAFGCWGLPGGVGQKVVSSWTKGFLSLLFAQTAQVFVLTTFPLILPAFPSLPSDKFGLLNIVFQALPRILILVATIKVPTVMGTGATKAIAQAGTVVGGAVAAAGAAAYQAV